MTRERIEARKAQRREAEEKRNRQRRNRYSLAGLALFLIAAAVYLTFDTTRITLTSQTPTYPVGTTEIVCRWSNGTLRTVTFGRSFTLEREDGHWQPVAPQVELRFTMEAYTLPLLGSRTVAYDLEPWGPLPPGKYRIVTDCLMNEGASGATLSIYGQFTLE